MERKREKERLEDKSKDTRRGEIGRGEIGREVKRQKERCRESREREKRRDWRTSQKKYHESNKTKERQ